MRKKLLICLMGILVCVSFLAVLNKPADKVYATEIMTNQSDKDGQVVLTCADSVIISDDGIEIEYLSISGDFSTITVPHYEYFQIDKPPFGSRYYMANIIDELDL